MRRQFVRLSLAAAIVAGVHAAHHAYDLGLSVDTVDPDASVGERKPFGLFVDGEECVSRVIALQSYDWPNWYIALDGECAQYGRIFVTLSTRADMAYPRACGRETALGFGIVAEGETSTTAFNADANRNGNCTLTGGPTPAAPEAALAFEALVVRRDDAARAHRLSYQGRRR